MSYTLATYFGLVIAVLILTWAVILLITRVRDVQRSARLRQRTTPSRLNSWITLKPTHSEAWPRQEDVETLLDVQDVPSSSSHPRASQNGHSSQGK